MVTEETCPLEEQVSVVSLEAESRSKPLGTNLLEKGVKRPPSEVVLLLRLHVEGSPCPK